MPNRTSAKPLPGGIGILIIRADVDDGLFEEILKPRLEQKGLSCFRDLQIKVGEKWMDKLNEAYRSCVCCIPILTPESMKSPWLMFEMGALRARGKKLFPYMHCVGLTSKKKEMFLKSLPEFISELQHSEKADEVISAVESHCKTCHSQISDESLYKFANSSEALSYISRYLTEAKQFRNTRLISGDIKKDFVGLDRGPYELAIDEALKKGVYVYEIISPRWEPHCSALKQKSGPTYNYRVIKRDIPPMLNFAIMKNMNGESELIFGWLISEHGGFEDACFRVRDPTVVKCFEDWHIELYNRGE
jgi:hypothetical protein